MTSRWQQAREKNDAVAATLGVMAVFWVIQTLALALPTIALAVRNGGEIAVDPAS